MCVCGELECGRPGGRSGRIAWLAKKVRDLGMPLLSVIHVEPGPSTALGTGQADAFT